MRRQSKSQRAAIAPPFNSKARHHARRCPSANVYRTVELAERQERHLATCAPATTTTTTQRSSFASRRYQPPKADTQTDSQVHRLTDTRTDRGTHAVFWSITALSSKVAAPRGVISYPCAYLSSATRHRTSCMCYVKCAMLYASASYTSRFTPAMQPPPSAQDCAARASCPILARTCRSSATPTHQLPVQASPSCPISGGGPRRGISSTRPQPPPSRMSRPVPPTPPTCSARRPRTC
jgi:hypothetical protein